MTVFLDTGAWIAIADRNDQYAHQAGIIYTGLVMKSQRLITSDLVLVETYNLLLRTIGNKPTRDFANKLKMISSLQIITVSQSDSARAWKIIEKYSDKDFSFTDCTSFALMERLRIKFAFTFDSHFGQFGFTMLK